MIALNKVPYGLCRGSGKTKYKLPGDETIHERTCERCYGSLMEACSLELCAKMYSDLAQYIHPRRKAVELSTPDETGQLSIAAILRAKRLKRDEPAKASAGGPTLVTARTDVTDPEVDSGQPTGHDT